jgi:hypothetical protein
MEYFSLWLCGEFNREVLGVAIATSSLIAGHRSFVVDVGEDGDSLSSILRHLRLMSSPRAARSGNMVPTVIPQFSSSSWIVAIAESGISIFANRESR